MAAIRTPDHSRGRSRVSVGGTVGCREQPRSAQGRFERVRQQVPGSSPGSELQPPARPAPIRLFRKVQTFENAFEFFGIVVGDDQLALA